MSKVKEIFSLYVFQQQIAIAKKLNGWYYFLRKIPFVGKKLPLRFYQSFPLKDLLNLLGLIFSFVLAPFKKLIPLLISYGLANILFTAFKPFPKGGFYHFQSLVLGLMIWLAFSFVAQGVLRYFKYFDNNEVELLFSFHLPQKTFFYSTFYVKFAVFLVSYLVVFLSLFFIFKIPALYLINLWLSYLLFFLVGEACQRLKVAKNPSATYRRVMGILTALIFVAVFGGMIYGYLQTGWLFLNHISYTLVVIFGFLLFYYSKKISQEEDYLFYILTSSFSSIEQAAKETADTYFGEGIALEKDLKYQQVNLTNISDKHALDELLFKRYQGSLNRGLWLRVGALLVVSLIFNIGSVIAGEKATTKELLAFLPLSFFIIYLVSYGKKIVQICFINCDRSMLYYPFYRQKEVILSGLFYRLKKTFFYNSLPSLILFLNFVSLSLIGKNENPLLVIGLSFLGILSLTLLFSFHELFVYYLLQPFTSSLKVVNPLYKGISGVMYYLAYIQMRIGDELGSNITWYALIVSIAALVYVFIGSLVIYHKAPTTFRIKD